VDFNLNHYPDLKLHHHPTLIAVDKDATGAVHDCVSSVPDFCAEIAMAGEQNWKREKGRP
jgi:hypothetical protein